MVSSMIAFLVAGSCIAGKIETSDSGAKIGTESYKFESRHPPPVYRFHIEARPKLTCGIEAG